MNQLNLVNTLLAVCLITTLYGCGEDKITVIPHEEEGVATTNSQSLKSWLLDVRTFGTKSPEEAGVGTYMVVFEDNKITYAVIKSELFGDFLVDMKIGTFTLRGNSLKAHYTTEGVGWLSGDVGPTSASINESETYLIRKDGYKLVMNGRLFLPW